MFWVNGIPQTHVSLGDRSFQYGDGCFTTILTKNGELVFWPEHVERMEACLKTLQIPLPDWQTVRDWANLASLQDENAGIKIHFSRGNGGRGYSLSGVEGPVVTISNFAFPTHYSLWQKDGVCLGVCETRLGIQPLLAGHKHNNRLEQVLAKAEIEGTEFADAVTLNVQNHVIETTMANLFWVKDNDVYTPDLSLSGVAGVMRRKVLEFLYASDIRVEVGNFTLSEMLEADEVWMCNSLLGVAPVRSITTRNQQIEFPIGKLTKRLQGNLST
ncbi:aminodeoxychorismate lyase [Vibrio sp. B1FLJ16]|uniref:aminodeoxychorismate lyase n=1 Tax=Vibrio sp. B1FLJ16 TaxID=2751178 RepID=UPI0015F5FCCE|nr:aminodeoxychorismate lyase [Vibrio sp. B1FLJ16]CAD7803082.1 COG0115 Branched-chain amino acid aminotransferase 4-amino-4-deoxychorismate lyase [Vibrio sp. B1FLJ16]CAE6895093.1 COG0115 Branched-chain amino acid aminotransferase 4-amino-4-deoxychorismate lyase [Vibrio sp. B1FLJ16]